MQTLNLSVTSQLHQWYILTSYRVIISSTESFSLQIGEHSEYADSLLQQYQARSLCIVTAWNPFSEQCSQKTNILRNRILHTLLRKQEYILFPALGEPINTTSWQAEESFAILDISPEKIQLLLRSWQQHAAVWYLQGKGASLVWNKRKSHKNTYLHSTLHK